MNRLPFEVGQFIIKELSQQDINQCMLTCQDWANWIKASRLLTTVCITTQSGLNKFVKSLKENPSVGEQVRKLVIEADLDPDFNINSLTQHLHNLRIFYFNDTSKEPKKQTLTSSQPWFSSIREFIEESPSGITDQLLTSGECHQLKRLATKVVYTTPTSDFVGLLSNAANVKHLSLHFFSFDLDQMESIHSHMPSLTFVNIKMIIMEHNTRPSGIQPANTVTHFTLHSESFAHITCHTHWLNYITQKYPNLTEFHYIDDNKAIDDDDLDGHYVGFSTAFNSLLQSYGRQLKTLGLNTELLPGDVFERLDESNCRIQHLMLKTEASYQTLHRISRTEQVHSVETMDIDMVDDDDEILWIRDLTHIKNLRIDMIKGSIYGDIELPSILDLCGQTLEAFEIKTKSFSYDFTDQTHYPHVKKLAFYQASIPSDFDAFLTVAFPNLRELRFNACQFQGTRLNIPTLRLDYFEIVTDLPQDQIQNVLVITMKDNQRQWYSFGHQYRADGDLKNQYIEKIPAPYRIIPYQELSCTPSFVLVCDSIRHMSIRIADFYTEPYM